MEEKKFSNPNPRPWVRSHGGEQGACEVGMGTRARGEAGARVGRARPARAKADAHGGRAGRVCDEQGAVVSRLGEVWLYYELCSLIFFSFCFLID
jgi:hypothetical protein